jgi:hypothetical protein
MSQSFLSFDRKRGNPAAIAMSERYVLAALDRLWEAQQRAT